MIRLGLNGAAGRMGKRISSIIHNDKNTKLCLALEHENHAELGKDMGILNGEGSMGINLTSQFKNENLNAIIDFSNPTAALKLANLCAEHKIAFVTGTTGMSDSQLTEIRNLSSRIPVLIGSNMSLGVNLLFKFAAQIAKSLGDEYDIEIIEKHHRFKKDAPSGTAISIAQSIASEINRDLNQVAVNGREGQTGERTKKEIGIHAVRAGDIVGEHTIIYGALGETIELTHRAHTRDTFASGAVTAAKWISGKPPAVYTMYDVLGL